MAWLARMDARASHWPRVLFWGYLFVKWYLIGAVGLSLLYAWTQNTFAPQWLSSFGDSVLDNAEALFPIIALALVAGDVIRRRHLRAPTDSRSAAGSH